MKTALKIFFGRDANAVCFSKKNPKSTCWNRRGRIEDDSNEEHLEVLQRVEKSWEGQQLEMFWKKKTSFWMKVSFYCANHNFSQLQIYFSSFGF